MKRNKRGISLIVLVITIIVMIILASAIIISLSNSGVINRANEAVTKTNLNEVKQLASLIWADAYLEGNVNKDDIIRKLQAQGVDTDKYVIDVTDTGINVQEITTLGDLINSAADYGKTVDYTVTVDVKQCDSIECEEQTAITVSEWNVFYEDEENGYVFLIAENATDNIMFVNGPGENNTYEPSNLTSEEKSLYNIFKLGSTDYELTSYMNSQYVAYLINEYDKYVNTSLYGDNVIGAIGGPTIELLAASYNEKHGNEITPIVDIDYVNNPDDYNGMAGYEGKFGYFINQKGNVNYAWTKEDDLYNGTYWLASPSGYWDYDETGGTLFIINNKAITYHGYCAAYGVRPVVCLKSTTPAAIGTATDISLIK